MNIGGKILKSNIGFYSEFFAILFELGKYAFFKTALEAQINVHFVRYIFRRRENLFQDFWSPFSISFLSFSARQII